MKQQEKGRHGDMAKKGVHSSDLYETILMLETVEECKNFFDDLCTVSELRAMEQRYEVAKLLYDGMIYNEILERTGASSATISRVNRSLQYGADGYQVVFERRKKK
jgi:TrpR-related protein YerC/YecD